MMHLRSTCFFFILSISACFGQYAADDYTNYLADHACFFPNGIHRYEENGKYGFVYKNHRLSQPVYDTIYSFGTELCVVKRDSVFYLIDKNLRTIFYEPIRSVEKSYSTEKNAFLLSVQTSKGTLFTYTSNPNEYGEPQLTTYTPSRNPLWMNRHPAVSITDSIDNADELPEAPDRVNSIPGKMAVPAGPYNKILFGGIYIQFFPKEGSPFLRKRPGLILSDYLGESLITYRNPETLQRVVIDEATEDTVAISEFPFSSFRLDGRLYLANHLQQVSGRSIGIEIYDQKGQLLHTFTPRDDAYGREYKCRLDNGVITEELPGKLKKDNPYPLCNLYSAASLKQILQRVILYRQSKDYRLYYSPDERAFYLVKEDQLIYSFPIRKKQSVELETIENHPFSKELICLNILNTKEEVVESILVSSSGKVLGKSVHEFRMNISTDGEVIGVYEKNSTNKRFGIFSPGNDGLEWFVSKNNLSRVFTKNVLYYSDDNGDRLENLAGDTLLTFDQVSDAFSLSENHLLFMVNRGPVSSLYDEQIRLICDSCTIQQVHPQFPVFALSKFPNQGVFELTDEFLNPISTTRYRRVLKGDGKMIALLTEDQQVEYLELGKKFFFKT